MECSGGLWGIVAEVEGRGGGEMFLGTYTPKLDDKGRLTLPAKFRAALAGGLLGTKTTAQLSIPARNSSNLPAGPARRPEATRRQEHSCATWRPPPTNSIPTRKAESRCRPTTVATPTSRRTAWSSD